MNHQYYRKVLLVAVLLQAVTVLWGIIVFFARNQLIPGIYHVDHYMDTVAIPLFLIRPVFNLIIYSVFLAITKPGSKGSASNGVAILIVFGILSFFVTVLVNYLERIITNKWGFDAEGLINYMGIVFSLGSFISSMAYLLFLLSVGMYIAIQKFLAEQRNTDVVEE